VINRDAADEVPDEVVVVPEVEGAIVDLTLEATEPLAEVPAGPRPKAGAARRYRGVAATLVLIDAACLSVALLTAHWIRFGEAPDRGYVLGMMVSALVWVGVFHAHGLYTTQHMSGLEEFRRTLSAVVIGIFLVILLTFWFDVYLSRSWMALALVIALGLELVARGIVREHEGRVHAPDSLVRTLIVGGKRHASEPIETFAEQDSSLLFVGFVDISSLLASGNGSPDLVERIRAVIRRHQADCVLITSPTIGTRQMAAAVKAARQEGAVVRIFTHLSGVWASRVTAQAVGRDGVALTLRPVGLSRTQRIVKRVMDLVLAVISIVLATPVLLVAAVAIKVTSRGPVLFRQDHVTVGGRSFGMLKLRTMTVEADRDAEVRAIDTSAPFFKIKSDPRTTRVGGWLRRWSIDELPQLFNVLRGDMSVVGPRPLPADQVAANPEFLAPRHEVRAGITGWQQINGRAELDAEESVAMDVFYIENWSPTLDLYILMRTLAVVVTREGAY